MGTLSEVASGTSGHKISLQRFVLSVLLEDVVIQASQRLHLMSKVAINWCAKRIAPRATKHQDWSWRWKTDIPVKHALSPRSPVGVLHGRTFAGAGLVGCGAVLCRWNQTGYSIH